MLAPIALFAYNRPLHTRRCLESLAQNQLAEESVLYIYLDGPRHNATADDLNKIHEVLGLVSERNWCKETHIIHAEKNKGIGNSVIDGVTEIVNRYKKIIVLEDDLVLSRGFLKYMNEALDFYEHERQVMHISGYMFPVSDILPETFFYNSTSCWGWGTWSRAWDHFSSDSNFLWDEIVSKHLENSFTIDHTMDFDKLLLLNASIEKKGNEMQKARRSDQWNWDICWQGSVCLKGGFSLHPFPSLTRNTGHDDTGLHCKKGWWSKRYDNQQIADQIQVKKINIENNVKAWEAMKKFNRAKPGWWIKIKEKARITMQIK